MRRALLLGANLALGGLLLGWMLHRFGGPALAVLVPGVSILGLLAFGVVVALVIVSFAWRWRILLAGLGSPPPIGPLTWFRAAGQSLSALIPSGRIGGDPLRAWLVVRFGTPAQDAIATVAIDRALEIGAAMPFSIVFATILIQQGVSELQNALVTIGLGTLALIVAMGMTARRLKQGKGLVTAFARRTSLDSLAVVEKRMQVMAASEAAAAALVGQRRRMGLAFAVGIGANLLVVLEFWLLLAAFGLPADPVAIVAALFATAAAHQLPVPAGVGVLEGGQMWLFQILGHPPEVGLAVGLAVRLRELVWALPGIVYLLGRWRGRTPFHGAASPRETPR